MKVVIHPSRDEELKALPILCRHSPGVVLSGKIYVLSAEAASALRQAGIQFSEVSRGQSRHLKGTADE